MSPTYLNEQQFDGPSLPTSPLRTPVHHPSDPPHLDLFHRVWPGLDARQEQNRLLNLRSQVGQPHDVRHAGRGDLAFDFDTPCLSSNPIRSP